MCLLQPKRAPVPSLILGISQTHRGTGQVIFPRLAALDGASQGQDCEPPEFPAQDGGQRARRHGRAAGRPGLLDEVEAFLAVTGIKRSLLGNGATGNRSIVAQLLNGLSPTPASVTALRAWMASHASAGEWREIRARTGAMPRLLSSAPLPRLEPPARSRANGPNTSGRHHPASGTEFAAHSASSARHTAATVGAGPQPKSCCL